jgi:signal transduction histidine kinase
MGFRARITLVLVLAGVLPIVLLGWSLHRASRDELVAELERGQAGSTRDLARECARGVLEGAGALQLAATYIPFSSLSGDEIADVLQIPFRQLPALNVLAVLDADGVARTRPLYRAPGDATPSLADHEEVAPEDLDAFARHVPIAREAAVAVVGAPYTSPRTGAPRVAVAVALPGSGVLAAELSLAALQRRLDEVAGASGAAALLRADGGVAAAVRRDGQLGPEERALFAADDIAPRTLHRDGERWLATYAPVDPLGWGVLLERRASVALTAASRVRAYTVFWALAALLLTVALGALLARGVARPVAELSAGARALRDGDYAHRVQVAGDGELAELAGAFNHMAGEVRRRDAEIRAWNEELASRVERKTAELREAEDQIARSRRLAALGSLAAGAAHELNNPLTAIAGLVTVAREGLAPGHPDRELLDGALSQVARAGDVVRELQRFAERETAIAGQRYAPASPVLAALDERRAALEARSVRVELAVGEDVPQVVGDPGQLQDLVGRLVENAANAMGGGGALTVTLAPVAGDAVRLAVADTGPGIPAALRERIFDPFFTTKEGGGAGLGLSVCHAIAVAHHGKLTVDSDEGRGTCFTLVLPAAPAAPHLL